MSDLKQARVLLTAAERDISALHGMAEAAVFADEIYRASEARAGRTSVLRRPYPPSCLIESRQPPRVSNVRLRQVKMITC